MNRTPITGSSRIKSVGFENGEMHVEFHGHDEIFKYTGPGIEHHHAQLMAAENKDHYLQHIHGDRDITSARIDG